MDEILQKLLAPSSLTSVAVLVSAAVLWLAVKKGFTAYINSDRNVRGAGTRSATADAMFDAVKFAIMLGAVLMVLELNGVNVSAMVAGLGVASAIVGLALQDSLRDIVMGIHMMTDRFFEVGDVVRYENFEGVVISFNVRSTKLRSILDDSTMTICNRNISQIVKVSTWADIDLPLPYEIRPAQVRQLLEELADRIAGLEGVTDCVFKGTQDFGESAVVYKLRLFCPPQLRPQLRRDALAIVQDGLAAAGIQVPYRQVVVHHTGGEA